MVFPIQAKLDSAVSSAAFPFLLRRRELGRPFLGSPGNFWGPGSNSQIEI